MGVTEWIEFGQNNDGTHSIMCSRCGSKYKSKGHARSAYTRQHFNYCPMCGSKMGEKVARPTATSSTEVPWWIGE